MKHSLKMLAAAMLVTTPLLSAAEGLGFYTGANYAYVEDPNSSWSVSALEAIGGYKLSPYLSLELQLGAGVTEDDFSRDVDIEVDHYVNAFVKPRLPFGNSAIYALLGHSTIKTSLDGAINRSNTDDNFAYGVGASYYFTDLMSVNTEYKHLGEDVDAISLGFSYEF